MIVANSQKLVGISGNFVRLLGEIERVESSKLPEGGIYAFARPVHVSRTILMTQFAG